MISVIMPVWNGARFMDTAIASVVAQTTPEWELLIVDDGSTDDSLARAERWRDLVNLRGGEERIRVLSSGGSNSGMARGCNLAARKARYEIIAHLHQDDLYFPWRIERLLPLFDNHDMVFAPYEIWQNGKIKLWNIHDLWERNSYVCSSAGDREPPFADWARGMMQRHNSSVPLGVAHRRDLFEEVGGFQHGLVAATEGVAWRRMAERGARIGFCPFVAGRYNVRPDSQARTRRPFSIPSTEIQADHPLGSNGQYLDAEWFAALAREKTAAPATGAE
jgi:glycosyltransferase involved in cell wall biosynthesis